VNRERNCPLCVGNEDVKHILLFYFCSLFTLPSFSNLDNIASNERVLIS
jgi:hypothetical protein